jgi:hypothetical protein
MAPRSQISHSQRSLCAGVTSLLTAGAGPLRAFGFVSASCILVLHVGPVVAICLIHAYKEDSSDAVGALAVTLGVESDAWHHHRGETDAEMCQARVRVRTGG